MRLIRNNVEREVEGDAAIEKFKSAGYKLIDWETAEEIEKTKKELSSLSAAELKALAKEKGIEGASSLTKDELQAILKG